MEKPKIKRKLTQAELNQRRAAGKMRGAQLAASPAHQSAAGRAMVEKTGRGYMRFIARRGGRKLKRLEYLGYADQAKDPEVRQSWLDEAARYTDDGHGSRVMLGLWLKVDQANEPAPRRKRKIEKKVGN